MDDADLVDLHWFLPQIHFVIICIISKNKLLLQYKINTYENKTYFPYVMPRIFVAGSSSTSV